MSAFLEGAIEVDKVKENILTDNRNQITNEMGRNVKIVMLFQREHHKKHWSRA